MVISQEDRFKKSKFLLPCCNRCQTFSILPVKATPMKNLLQLSVIIIFFLISACDKDKSLVTVVDGTWELRSQKGTSNGAIYKFSGNNYEMTIGLNPSKSGTFKISKVTDDDRNSGVIYPYRITFIIDGGSKLGTYLNVSDTTIVMSSGQAGVDEKNFIYDKVK